MACLITGCSGGSASALPTATPASGAGKGLPESSDTPYTCPSNASTSSGTLDCAKLPLGDLKYTLSGPKAGDVYVCNAPQNGSPVVQNAPWLNASAETWDAPEKIAVVGSVSWPGRFSESVSQSGATRTIMSNGLPVAPMTTGTFPIAPSDPAWRYDHNPNSIGAQNFDVSVPVNPAVNATPSCLSGGAIGITVTGVAVFDGFDAAGYDAVAREEQDACHGHPDQSSTYHYHGWLQACVPDAGSPAHNSSLLGYAADGFGIYGPWYGGKILTSADLDVCHGATSAVMWDGKLVTMYHYVSTYDFPYTLGCYRGTPVQL